MSTCEKPTELKFKSRGISGNNVIKLKTCCPYSRAAEIYCNTIRIKEDNFFVLTSRIIFTIDKCHRNLCPKCLVELINVDTREILSTITLWSCKEYKLVWEGLLFKGTRLGFKISHQDQFDICDFNLEGLIDVDQRRFKQNQELARDTLFDKNLHIQYIPSKPPTNAPAPAPPYPPQYPADAVFPWNTINIPWRLDLSIPSGQTEQVPLPQYPNNNYYQKHQSIQYSVLFFLGLDSFTIPPNSPELTIFLKNFEDRGDKNYLKMVYMSAVRCATMPNYQEKMDTYLNNVRTAITINQEPVLSAIKRNNILFFLAMHVGYDDYPEYVIKYFTLFVDVVGFGDPDRPGRNEAMIYGNTHAQAVKDYFATRTNKIIQEEDASTYIYHWHKAGLPLQSILIEAVHNDVAFMQYVNTTYKIISDKIWAVGPSIGNPIPFYYPQRPIPSPLPCINFFEKMAQTSTEQEKINVSREIYRLMNTNTNAFRKLVWGDDDSENPRTQARHIWQGIMISNQPYPTVPQKVGAFFTYNTTQYTNFPASFECPIKPPKPVTENYDPSLGFQISDIDSTFTIIDNVRVSNGDGSVQDIDMPNLIPVFDKPTNCPLGLGYGRCAGEIQNILMGIKITERFADLDWEVRSVAAPPNYTSYVTIAPFLAVPDNIYVKRYL